MSKVKMQGPVNSGGFSHGGQVFEADADGIIELPSEFTGFAKDHGFTPIVEKGPKKLEPLAKAEDAKNGGGKKNAKPTDAEDAEDAKNGGGK